MEYRGAREWQRVAQRKRAVPGSRIRGDDDDVDDGDVRRMYTYTTTTNRHVKEVRWRRKE